AGPANIDDTVFTLNTASAGGALLIGSGSRVSDLGNSTYLSNTAAITSGGAVLNYGRYSLGGVTFTANEAQTSGGAFENMAGASLVGGLFVQGAATSLASLFQDNSAVVDGGGAEVSGRFDDRCSRFIRNHASDDAGGLMGESGSVLVLTATRFISNTAADLGG